MHYGSHQFFRVAVLCAYAGIGIGKDAFVHAFLDAKVEHGLLFTVVNARYAGQVALLVVGFYALYNAGGQVFQGGLGVARHKLFAVNLNLLNLFSVDGYLSFVAYLSARKAFYQFFNGRPFGGAVGGRVILEGVVLYHHLFGLPRHGGSFQHHGIGAHLQLAQCRGAVLYINVAYKRFIAYARQLQQIVSCLWRGDAECSFVVGQCARHV